MKRFQIAAADDATFVVEGVAYDDGYVYVRAPENTLSMNMRKEVWEQVKDSFFTNGFTYKEVD